MEEHTVVSLPTPGSGVTDDPLLAVLREGARRMLMQAIEAEVEMFLAAHSGLVDEGGRRRLVRNGHAPERQIQTGIGPVQVRRPKVRDRATEGSQPIRFTSAVLPAYLRRTKNLEELLPWLYLKGVSTGQFAEALTALLGPQAPGLSATTVRRLTEAWQQEHEHWQQRDLSGRRYVYVWADGVYFSPQLDHERQCLLVLIGADALPTVRVVETLRHFLGEGVQWRELRATVGRACGSTLRRRLDSWHAVALLRQVHAVLIRMVRAGPEIMPWDVVVDSCSARAKHGGELTGPNPTDRGKLGTKYHVVVATDGIPLGAIPSAANVHDTRLFPHLLHLALAVCAGIGRLFGDAGYDSAENRGMCLRDGIQPQIRRIG